MPTFAYKAKTRNGQLVNGTLAAGDRRLALAELGRLGYFPLAVELREARRDGPAVAAPSRARASNRELLRFTQQLSTLLRSGMSLRQALGALERRAQHKAFGAIISQIRNDITQGVSLSDALGKYPRIFSGFYINLVRAGEASGTLHEVLERLQRHNERIAEVREKVVTALIYPLLIVLVGIGTITFFMMVMVPKFAEMFKEMNRVMPLPTRILIEVSDAFTRYWWIGALVLLAAGLIYRQQSRTERGRLFIDGLKLRLPVFGNILRANAFSQFARTLATLLQNGVPVLTALQITESTMINKVIASEIREARTRVTDGTSISQPLAKGKIFPPLLIDMLTVGEESGAVAPALENIADTYEQELSYYLKVFTSLLEPAIIIAIALVVGGIVLSVLLAVFDMTSGIGR
jgi:type II secretory pathway component PulF